MLHPLKASLSLLLIAAANEGMNSEHPVTSYEFYSHHEWLGRLVFQFLREERL